MQFVLDGNARVIFRVQRLAVQFDAAASYENEKMPMGAKPIAFRVISVH